MTPKNPIVRLQERFWIKDYPHWGVLYEIMKYRGGMPSKEKLLEKYPFSEGDLNELVTEGYILPVKVRETKSTHYGITAEGRLLIAKYQATKYSQGLAKAVLVVGIMAFFVGMASLAFSVATIDWKNASITWGTYLFILIISAVLTLAMFLGIQHFLLKLNP
jgi:hypothetical protein